MFKFIKKRNAGQPKVRQYSNGSVKITRAGLSSNPVERFSFTGGTVFSNDQLVKHGGAFFIGGDTATYEYDMSLKVAGSVVECPMKIYKTRMSVLQPPTNITGNAATGFIEFTSQSDIDFLKTQDVSSLTRSDSNNGDIEQFMLELDLTPLCNSMFGGSNAALKAALKAINVDVWAMGSGSNAGVLTNGVNSRIWYDGGSSWGSSTGITMASNTTGSIAKMTFMRNDGSLTYYVNSSNKLYILIVSQYSSDGVISSSVSLDYINIKVDIARTVDTVQPISVNLPKYWAMVGSFSPNYTNTITTTGAMEYLLSLRIDDNNIHKFYFNESDDKIRFDKRINGVTVPLLSSAQTFNKNQVIKFVVGQSATGMFLYLLLNNGTVQKYTNTDTNILNGILPFSILSWNGTSYQANAFAESFTLVDLQRLGKQNGFTDAEAQSILQGILPNPLGIQNPELFDISKVSLHANATLNNGVITLNATAAYQSSTITIPVLPNNQYILTWKETHSANHSEITISEYYNNVWISNKSNLDGASYTFVTSGKTNKLILYIDSWGSGTFTFSNISLKRKD